MLQIAFNFNPGAYKEFDSLDKIVYLSLMHEIYSTDKKLPIISLKDVFDEIA
jgi:hypothetical protein